MVSREDNDRSPGVGSGERRSGMAVVVNPHARGVRVRPQLVAELRRVMGEVGGVTVTRTRAELQAAADDLRRANIDLLAVVGGDSTAGCTLTALHRAYGSAPLPRVALVRGGTMNTVANSLGVPRRAPAKLLRSVVRRHLRGQGLVSQRRVTLRVRSGDTDQLGFLFGTGVGHGFLAAYESTPGAGGALRAARVLGGWGLRAWWGQNGQSVFVPSSPLVLEVDGARWPATPLLGVFAGSVAELGLGFRAFPRTGEGIEGMHVLAVRGPAARVARRLWRLRAGRALGRDLAREALAQRLVFWGADGRAAPRVPYFVDGDLYEPGDGLVVSLGPRVLLVQ